MMHFAAPRLGEWRSPPPCGAWAAPYTPQLSCGFGMPLKPACMLPVQQEPFRPARLLPAVPYHSPTPALAVSVMTQTPAAVVQAPAASPAPLPPVPAPPTPVVAQVLPASAPAPIQPSTVPKRLSPRHSLVTQTDEVKADPTDQPQVDVPKSVVEQGDTANSESPHVQILQVHVCPSCGGSFPTLEDCQFHWISVHAEAAAANKACALDEPPPSLVVPTVSAEVFNEVGVNDAVGDGGEKAASAVEAEASCTDDRNLRDDLAARAALNGGAVATVPQNAQCLKRHDDGTPLILRVEDPETGVTRTIVFNDDGTQRVFGEKTVSSMAETGENEIAAWLDAMTDLHLRGLVHEVSERVCRGSERYHAKKKDLERRSETRHYEYFGLSPERSCERELDAVYRRLAREMHPDKNGGTEEAKEQFQDMKRKYEDLKQRIAKDAPQHLDHDTEPNNCGDNWEKGSDSDARGAGSGCEQCDSETIDCYTDDRAELEKLAWKMLRQLKAIIQGMRNLASEHPDGYHEEVTPNEALANFA